MTTKAIAPRLLLGCTILALQLAASGSAHAQSYEESVERGVLEFSAGNWEEAYVNFGHAHELRPGPRPLRGMGMCLYEQKRYAETIEALRGALELKDTEYPLTDEMLEATHKLLAAAQKYVVKLTIVVSPADAKLELDGRPATAGTQLVDSGSHELVATHGGKREVRELDVRLGEDLEVEVDLAASATTASVSTGGGDSLMPIIAFSVAGAGIATMATFGLMALSEYDDLEGSCGESCSDSEVSTLQTYTLVADVGLGVGIAAAAVGLWLWSRTDEDDGVAATTSVLPLVGPDQVGVMARGAL